jgi:GT2 family glycosyltransferase
MNQDVSIIIVNWNGERLLPDLFNSLKKQRYKDFDIVFVDNASSDNSNAFVERLSQNFPCNIHIVGLSENRGFTGGNIEGLKYCSGKYVVLLNNDTVTDENWLYELVSAIDSHPGVGVCASKLVAYGTDVIDSAGDGYATTSLKGFKRGEGEDSRKFTQQEYIFGACGGAAMYRREILNDIGFLDEDFFLIHEDTDLNFRAQLAGWKVLYVPTAVVYHKVRSSIGYMSDKAIYYTLRNSEFVRIKNVPLCIFLRCLPEFIVGMITEFIYFAIKHKKFGLYLKSKFDVIKMLPVMLKKRRDIMKKKRVGNKYLYSIMTSVWEKEFMRKKVKKLLREDEG